MTSQRPPNHIARASSPFELPATLTKLYCEDDETNDNIKNLIERTVQHGRQLNSMVIAVFGVPGSGKVTTMKKIFNRKFQLTMSDNKDTSNSTLLRKVSEVSSSIPSMKCYHCLLDTPISEVNYNTFPNGFEQKFSRHKLLSETLQSFVVNPTEFQSVQPIDYPILLFFVSADTKIQGQNTRIGSALQSLKETNIIQKQCSHLIVVVTRGLQLITEEIPDDYTGNVDPEKLSYCQNENKLRALIKNKVETTLGIENVPVVFLENKPMRVLEKYPGTKYYKLPNGEVSHQNLLQAISQAFLKQQHKFQPIEIQPAPLQGIVHAANTQNVQHFQENVASNGNLPSRTIRNDIASSSQEETQLNFTNPSNFQRQFSQPQQNIPIPPRRQLSQPNSAGYATQQQSIHHGQMDMGNNQALQNIELPSIQTLQIEPKSQILGHVPERNLIDFQNPQQQFSNSIPATQIYQTQPSSISSHAESPEGSNSFYNVNQTELKTQHEKPHRRKKTKHTSTGHMVANRATTNPEELQARNKKRKVKPKLQQGATNTNIIPQQHQQERPWTPEERGPTSPNPKAVIRKQHRPDENCFSSETWVFAENSDSKTFIKLPIGNLKGGTKLSTISANFYQSKGFEVELAKTSSTKFCTFLHSAPEKMVDYTYLFFSNGRELQVSDSHLIITIEAGCIQPIKAGKVSVGDSVVAAIPTDDGSGFKVEVTKCVRVTRKVCKGAFAPLTFSGTFFANGIWVTSYADVDSFVLAEASLAPLKLWHFSKQLFEKSSSDKYDKKSKQILCRNENVNFYARGLINIRSFYKNLLSFKK